MTSQTDDEPQEPRRGRWRSKHTKGRASIGLGFDTPRLRRLRAAERRRNAAEAEEWLRRL